MPLIEEYLLDGSLTMDRVYEVRARLLDFRAAKARAVELRLLIGEELLLVCPMGEPGTNSGVKDLLEAFASEVGVGFEWADQTRKVAAAWAGTDVPADRVTWSALRALMGEARRDSILAALVDDLADGVVVTEKLVRERRRHTTTPIAKSDPESGAEQSRPEPEHEGQAIADADDEVKNPETVTPTTVKEQAPDLLGVLTTGLDASLARLVTQPPVPIVSEATTTEALEKLLFAQDLVHEVEVALPRFHDDDLLVARQAVDDVIASAARIYASLHGLALPDAPLQEVASWSHASANVLPVDDR